MQIASRPEAGRVQDFVTGAPCSGACQAVGANYLIGFGLKVESVRLLQVTYRDRPTGID